VALNHARSATGGSSGSQRPTLQRLRGRGSSQVSVDSFGVSAGTENSATPIIEASHVSLTIDTADGPLRVLNDISVSVRPGEYVGIVGPSGSGKTMFLNTIAGIEHATAGELRVFGEPPVVGRQGVGYAMARDGLLPWRTALGNVELSLEALGVPKEERRARARAALERVDLGDFCGAYRAQLSQGMRQRVALARTLISNPRLLLLDEPFAALDAQTRIVMQERLLELLNTYDGTVFLVTHDLAEAILLSDRVIVFTRRPAQVKREFEINLPRPRSSIQLRSTEEFQRLQAEIWAELAGEVTEL
jgi:NitT/TauT family transport system ATP-binding protein